MNKSFLTLFLAFTLACVALSETIPFANVYMRSYNVKDKKVTSYYWGPSGNFTLNQNADPRLTTITLTLLESAETKLSPEVEASLAQYVDFQRVAGNFVIMTYKATQISISEYDSKRCGLFQDTEDTYDIDMPIDMKSEQQLEYRLEFSYVFDVNYSDILDSKYQYLENICAYKTNALSLE